MALTDYRTYTQVCEQDKFPDLSKFKKPTETTKQSFNIQKVQERDELSSPVATMSFQKKYKYTLTQDELTTIIAIARLETGNFTSDAYVYGNNYGGLSVDEEPLHYESKEAGYEAFVTNLIDNYFSEGLHTPEEIGNKYCPVNPEWADLIQELKEEGVEQWEQYLFQ